MRKTPEQKCVGDRFDCIEGYLNLKFNIYVSVPQKLFSSLSLKNLFLPLLLLLHSVYSSRAGRYSCLFGIFVS